MGCILVLLLLAFPRVVMVVLFLTTNYLQRAYHGLLLPLLGFFFLPLTTLVYAWLQNNNLPLAGINVVFLLIALFLDLGGMGGGEYHRRSRY